MIKNELTALYQFDSCESSQGGKEHVRGVDLDDTATGILGELPEYEREMVEISSAADCNSVQYLLREATQRKFEAKLFAGAGNTTSSGTFSVEMSSNTGVDIFFDVADDNQHTYVCAKFLRFCFRIFRVGASISKDDKMKRRAVRSTAS